MARTTEHKEGNATVRIIYRTAKILKDGSHPFWIRITKDRKTTFVATGLSLHPKYWNDKYTGYREAIRKSYPEPYREELITRLTQKEEQYSGAARSLASADEVHDAKAVAAKAIEGRKQARRYTLLEYLSEQITAMERAGKVGNCAVYRDLKNQLTDFIKRTYPGQSDVRFEAITVRFCNAFEAYFQERGNAETSLSVRFRTLRTLYNRAIAEGAAKLEHYPFARNSSDKHKFSVGKFDTRTRKRAINRGQIRQLEAYEPTGTATGKYAGLRNQIKIDRLQRAKAVFLFSFYAGGVNFVDLAQLRWRDLSINAKTYHIHYVRQKTGGQFTIRLIAPAAALIEQLRSTTYNGPDSYIFPILDAATHLTAIQIKNRLTKILGQVNSDLKAMGKGLGIETPLTTYVARHSFATSLKRSGVLTSVIADALGHKSESVTSIYLDSFDNQTVDAAFDTLL